MNKTDLQLPYTLVGPTVKRPVQDPLAVLLLDNRLYILHCGLQSFRKNFSTIVKVRFGPLGLNLRPRALLF